jgi:hypothetical protein
MTAALAWPNAADAREPKRRGVQAEAVVGASACIPASGDCKSDTRNEGKTGPSGALEVDLGWRVHPVFFVGAGYSVGWFNPTWKLSDQRIFDNAFQQAVFGVLRVYVPVWRIDIGLELSPGWSRQTFVVDGTDKRDHSNGFALRPGLSVDFRLLKRLFIGGRVDFILAFHEQMPTRQLPVHQVIGGVHFGFNI